MSSSIPPTRQSLLLKIQRDGTGPYWLEFESIYRPAVYRYVRRRKLQAADAEDVTQAVFLVIAKKIPQWHVDRAKGSFRAWLLVVTRNAVLNFVTRRPPDSAEGGESDALQIAPEAHDDSEHLDWELRRAAFRHAANIVRDEFRSSTWLAFWKTSVEQIPAKHVANELNMSVSAVYTARCRVLQRLRDVAQSIHNESL